MKRHPSARVRPVALTCLWPPLCLPSPGRPLARPGTAFCQLLVSRRFFTTSWTFLAVCPGAKWCLSHVVRRTETQTLASITLAGRARGRGAEARLLCLRASPPGPHCRSPPWVREHGPLPRKAAARAGACVPPLAEPPFRRPHEPRPASNTHTFVGCLARGLVRPGSILALPQGVSFPRIPGLQARARGCEWRRARVARAFSLSEPEGPGPAW